MVGRCLSIEYVSITIEFKTKVERFLFPLNYRLKDIVCCIGLYQAKREESVNFIIIDEIIKQFVNNKKANKCFICQYGGDLASRIIK